MRSILLAVAALWAAGAPLRAQTSAVAPVGALPAGLGQAGAAPGAQVQLQPPPSSVLSLNPSALPAAPGAVPPPLSAAAEEGASALTGARAISVEGVAAAPRANGDARSRPPFGDDARATARAENGRAAGRPAAPRAVPGALAEAVVKPSLVAPREFFRAGRAAEPSRPAGPAKAAEGPDAARVAAKRAALESRLDQLFDNRKAGEARAEEAPGPEAAGVERGIPGGEVLLARAAAKGVPHAALASAIAGAGTELEAVAGIERLGLLEPGESASATDAYDRHFSLLRVWHDASASAGPPLERSFPIPALTATRDGVVYFVHAVAHGRLRPAGRSRVMALVERLEAEGRPLYSEQNLPAAYGYGWGRELLDHAAAGDARAIEARPASEAAGGPLRRLVARAIDLAVAPGSLLLPVPLLASDWTSPLGWLALAVVALVNLALLTSLLPWSRFLMRYHAERDHRRLGNDDMLHHYRAYADLAQRASSGVAEILRVELPMPLKQDPPEGLREGVRRVNARSKAMAEAAAREAAAAGAREVHLLVGLNHAQEIVWHLKASDTPPA